MDTPQTNLTMKIDPGFPNHWKTERLIARAGPQAIVCLLRLWGNAQINRKWNGLPLTPKRLAMETKWFSDENLLWDALTDPDCPWLDAEEGGTWAIHGFEEHQKQVIHLWQSGNKGGRPTKKKNNTSSSSYSSSYPICEPNENHMVLEAGKTGKKFSPPSPEEATEYALSIGFKMDGNEFCDFYQSRGWKIGKTSMKDWKAAVRTWRKNAQARQPELVINPKSNIRFID